MRFEALQEQLLVGGIAPWRVRRYLAELEDHLAALTEQEHAMGYDLDEAALRARALLGDDDDLSAAWLARPDLKSFAARAPWAVFVLAPPFALLLAFVVPTLTLVAIAKTHGMMMHNAIAAPAWFQQLSAILILASNLLVPALLATLLVRTAMRQRLPLKWPLIGLAMIALLGMQMHASFPQPGHRGGYIMLGALPFAGHLPAYYWRTQPTQWLFMLAPTLWLVIASRRVDRRKKP